MRQKVKKASLRRLASLSALGAGTLGAAAGRADAAIVYSGIIDQKVGFTSGYGSSAAIPLPNGAAGVLFKQSIRDTAGSPGYQLNQVLAKDRLGPHGTAFRLLFQGTLTSNPVVLAFPQGAKFGSAVATSRGMVAESKRYFDSFGPGYEISNFDATNRYLLFEFTGGKLTHPIYGWAKLGVTLIGYVHGPDVTLISWAYETSGAQIPAGFHGKASDGSDDVSMIEQSTFDASGLSALALGAVGVRNWRAARSAEASGLAGSTP